MQRRRRAKASASRLLMEAMVQPAVQQMTSIAATWGEDERLEEGGRGGCPVAAVLVLVTSSASGLMQGLLAFKVYALWVSCREGNFFARWPSTIRSSSIMEWKGRRNVDRRYGDVWGVEIPPPQKNNGTVFIKGKSKQITFVLTSENLPRLR